mmetsp:Transcript_4569/g.6952  ORF Transcript_4569/g.6952 Transcript_4569/m.6952 type:complete len:225 (-) Transcript_4569:418-1092(-)
MNLNGVSYSEIISNNLNFFSYILTEGSPVGPVILVKGILNGDDGIFGDHILVHGNELISGKKKGGVPLGNRCLEVKVIFVLSLNLELRSGNIKSNGNLIEVSSPVGGLHEHGKSRLNITGRSKSTLVSNKCSITSELSLDDRLEVVEDFASNNHRLGEVLGSSGDDEELLECKLVSGVLSSIDDVEAWNWEGIRGGVAGNVGVVLPEGNSLGSSSGLGGGKRNS